MTRDVLLKYLQENEGDYIHFNRGEKDITSAYGIYRYAHPKASIFAWYKQLRKQYGIGSLKKKKNRKKLNEIISTKPFYKEIEKDLAYDFYMNNLLNHTVLSNLDKHSGLTYASIAINGGRKRGIKALQYALSRVAREDISIDGKVGPQTIMALKGIKGNYVYLNNYMIEYMLRFYDRLVRSKPKKYARYKKGWYNRMNKLKVRIG